MPISRSDVGAWLLKCNPRIWDLRSFIADGHRYINRWKVAKDYRSDLMEEGDRVILWATGPTAGAVPRGIWALGHVTDHAYPVDSGSTFDDDVESYWLDKEKSSKADFFVPVALEILREPILASALTSVNLRDLEIFRQAWRSNPSFVTPAQLARLTLIIPAWPEHPRPDDE